MVAIVDYEMGNLRSVLKVVKRLGFECIISRDKSELGIADKLILPGVGHFTQGMSKLREFKLIEFLNEVVIEQKKPVLGICLGMQLMAKHSEEGDVDGFNWFDAMVVKFKIVDNLKYKIPHMGWNQINIIKESSLLIDVPDLSELYFDHSYYIRCNNSADVLSETEYECTFTSAIEKGNLFGVQFHPEKSHDVGELVLKNFLRL